RTLGRDPLRLLRWTATPYALLSDRQLGPQLHLIHRYPGLGANLVHIEGVAPRVYLARRTFTATSVADALAMLQRADILPGQDAVVEGNGNVTEIAGECQLTQDRIEQLKIRCHADNPGYLIVSDAYFPGWYASVNGAPTPIVRANAIMRGVAIPAGDSTI